MTPRATGPGDGAESGGDGKPARQHHRPSGYTEPEKEVMHQVVTFLTGKVSAFSVTPADEPVLS
ncbi:hypothetical protein FFT48_04520 [Klebsiella pneumoniae]|nr:hypothetical protein FFT48_04520 [Klebsiella pneumoniae]